MFADCSRGYRTDVSGPDITVRWAFDGWASLSELRRTVYATALRTDVPADAVDGFVVAVSEVATNALVHGVPPFRVVLSAAAQALQCAVTDGGGGISDEPALTAPLDGSRPDHGMGLWAVHELCDSVTYTRDDDGFTVQVAVEG